jgi:hypothetical protein
MDPKLTPQEVAAATALFLTSLRTVRNQTLDDLIHLKDGFVLGWPQHNLYINGAGDGACHLNECHIFAIKSQHQAKNQDGEHAVWLTVDKARKKAIKLVKSNYDMSVETCKTLNRKYNSTSGV